MSGRSVGSSSRIGTRLWFIARMLGSTQDAEDLAQETLLRAWRALERFEPRVQFQTWLYRIATNACLDELERRPRRPEPVDPFPDRPWDEAASPTYDHAARYAIREGMELALLRAIQELPGRQRAVLIFRDVLGWTAPEVAEVLGSTVASVNSALQRARGTIEQHLPETTRPAAGPDERELLNRYVAAFEHADMDGLVALLREDATLRMPPQPMLAGGLRIARFFLEAVARGDLTRIRHRPTWANGRPAVTIEVRARRWRLDPARGQRARDRGGPDRRDRRVSRSYAAAAVRGPGYSLGALAKAKAVPGQDLK
jgi:RNA polymerase sigma-70 factor (ECF subfamily)